MDRIRILFTLLFVVLSVYVVSNAEARHGHGWHFYGVYGNTDRGDNESRRPRAAEPIEAARGRTGGGAFGAVIDRLVRGCLQQAAEFQSWPFDAIAKIASPDDAQRRALDALRASTGAAAQRLSADCPQDQPAPPSARLEAAERAIDTATATFDAVETPLRELYGALDDEQKARLLRDMTVPGSQARDRDRRAERAERGSRGPGESWAGICEQLVAALRGWPVREIERGVRLSQPQRVSFYELVSTSLKAADTLAGACPAEIALTPPGRMSELRARLSAVRKATIAIHPALTQFYEALDQGQKVRFAGMR